MLIGAAMRENSRFSQIVPVFDEGMDCTNSLLYKNVMINVLQKILPQGDFSAKLPIVASMPNIVYCDHLPCQLSFYVVSQYRPNAFKFILEMISRWLVPGKQLDVVLMYNGNFRLSENDPAIYTISEVKVKIEEKQDLDAVQFNLPIIETELRLGISSSYYARRILELKGLYPEEKTAAIHEDVAKCLKRFPKLFQNDIYHEMQHILVMCNEAFKEARLSRHLCKIIHLHYLYRRSLRNSVAAEPEKRHVVIKLFPSKLYLQNGRKSVLSLVVGMNFLSGKEVFDESHLMSAIQNYFPNTRAVERSYFVNRHPSEKISTIYIEVEKNDGAPFTIEERMRLQKLLPSELKERIEPMMHPVFMPCNEEEIMRNILSLSQQVRYLRDMPQVFISFDQQSRTELYFTVIAVRVMKPGSLSVHEMFKRTPCSLEYTHDRCKRVGYLRKKYPKEASVFRVSLPKAKYVRKDHSIDLHKARQTVVAELTKVMGEIRDYNGGMISKQSELLTELKSSLVDYDDLELENFFYSLTPVVIRTLLEPQMLMTLFLMQAEAKRGKKEAPVNIRIEPGQVFIMIATGDKGFKGRIIELLAKFGHQSNEIAISCVQTHGINYMGFIYRSDDIRKQREFCQLAQQALLQEVEQQR